MSDVVKFVFLIFFVCFMLLIGPWLFIWAINTLISAAMASAPAGSFVPQIVFGFWTWLAAAIVGGFAILPSVRRS